MLNKGLRFDAEYSLLADSQSKTSQVRLVLPANQRSLTIEMKVTLTIRNITV